MKNVVFWDPSYSPHKIAFVDEVAKALPRSTIDVFADTNLDNDRLSLGWKSTRLPKIQWDINPSSFSIKERAFREPKDTLHVLSGIRWVRTITSAIKYIKQSGAHFAIMQEPRVREGWRGELRFLQSLATERWFRKNAEFVLAIGRNGPTWFESVGYPADRIFPFAYFVDEPKFLTERLPPRNNSAKITIGYAGRLVAAKGIFDLVQAVSLLGHQGKLLIAGTGPDEGMLRSLCSTLKLDVEFVGVIPIDDIGIFMSQLDVLVLASTTKDGWGVVVSEALMCGTAVVTTPCVGASILMENPVFGHCVPINSPYSIAESIRILASNNAFSNKIRLHRRRVATSVLSAKGGAEYFAEIVKWRFEGGPRPTPFWQPRLVTI
jgi:glycosyltransferase involved in cell wall biosynthesis